MRTAYSAAQDSVDDGQLADATHHSIQSMSGIIHSTLCVWHQSDIGRRVTSNIPVEQSKSTPFRHDSGIIGQGSMLYLFLAFAFCGVPVTQAGSVLYSYILLAGGFHMLECVSVEVQEGVQRLQLCLLDIVSDRGSPSRSGKSHFLISHRFSLINNHIFNNSLEIYRQEAMFGKAPERSRRPTDHAKSSKQYPTSSGQQQLSRISSKKFLTA